MRAINLANAAKRDAQVGFASAQKAERAVAVTPEGERPRSVRYVKSVARVESLIDTFGGLPELGQAIIDGDPEIDVETVGKYLDKPVRVYVSADGQIVYRVRMEQVVHNPDGSERERRELSRVPANIAADTPIQWSKRTFPKADAVRKFVFSRSYQITHTNGLTFDFLYQMAEELERDNVLRLVGSGPQGTGPLILTTGGEPYRGFLEGRTHNGSYLLVLHLTNLELKALEPDAQDGADQ